VAAQQVYKIPLDLDDIDTAVYFQLVDTPGAGKYFPDQIYGNASLKLEFTITNGANPTTFGGTPTFNIYGKPDDSNIAKVLLVAGSALANVVTFEIPKDKIDNDWSRYVTSDWPVVLIVEIDDGVEKIYRKARVKVIDSEAVGLGVAVVSDANEIIYTASVSADWDFAASVPLNMEDAADTLAKTINTPVSEQALTDAVNIAWPLDVRKLSTVTLTNNRTLDNPTNLIAGAEYTLRITQDGTGSRTLAYGTAYKFPGGIAPTLTLAAGSIDEIRFTCDGTNLYGIFTRRL